MMTLRESTVGEKLATIETLKLSVSQMGIVCLNLVFRSLENMEKLMKEIL